MINPGFLHIWMGRNPHLEYFVLQYQGHKSTHHWSCDKNQEEWFAKVLLIIPTQYLYYTMPVPHTYLPRQMNDYLLIIAWDLCKASCILTTQNIQFSGIFFIEYSYFYMTGDPEVTVSHDLRGVVPFEF